MSSNNRDDIKKYGCLLTHPLCQQDARGCHPTMSEHPHYTLFVFALFHFLIFILVISTGATTVEYKERYDDKCFTGESTYVTFDVKTELNPPIYFYFELDNFYQNHFRYAGSNSFEQLQGKYVEDPTGCEPISTEKESPDSDHKITYAPCGLASRYMFNDSYILPETFTEQGIAWPEQINKSIFLPNSRYSDTARWMRRQSSVNPSIYVNETLNEHYLNWMQTSHRRHFKKLYAVNNGTKVASGPFTVIINCNYDSSLYKYKRYVSLMKPGNLGGKNQMIWVLNLVMSILTFFGGMLFVYFHHKVDDQGNKRFYVDPLELITKHD